MYIARITTWFLFLFQEHKANTSWTEPKLWQVDSGLNHTLWEL